MPPLKEKTPKPTTPPPETKVKYVPLPEVPEENKPAKQPKPRKSWEAPKKSKLPTINKFDILNTGAADNKRQPSPNSGTVSKSSAASHQNKDKDKKQEKSKAITSADICSMLEDYLQDATVQNFGAVEKRICKVLSQISKDIDKKTFKKALQDNLNVTQTVRCRCSFFRRRETLFYLEFDEGAFKSSFNKKKLR